jgi:hypothetical protein
VIIYLRDLEQLINFKKKLKKKQLSIPASPLFLDFPPFLAFLGGIFFIFRKKKE